MAVISSKTDGHIGIITLDNPDKRNAMGLEFWTELPAAVEEVDANEEIRVIVVQATGPHFSVGLDLKGGMGAELPSLLQGGMAGERRRLLAKIKEMQRTMSCLAATDKPVIAAIHGWCIGGGLDLVSSCDIRLASADANFSLRETRIAMVADVGSLQRLPGIIGRGQLAELAYTGRDFDAEFAREIGLVNRVLPDGDACRAAALELAREIAANSPLATQGTKRVLRYGESRRPEDGLDYVALWNTAFLPSADLMEAMVSFMEKREPKYKGT